MPGADGTTTTPQPQPSPTSPELSFAEPSGVGGGGDYRGTASSYIDSAIPQNVMRFRFDSYYDINRPDRGEFYYAKCGCFAAAQGVRAPGPPLMETDIKSTQEYSAYIEWAPSSCLSGFIEVPIRAINPEVNANNSGLGDINFGMKYAFWQTEDTVATFQFRTYVPSGDSTKGLGTDHTTLEPALLLYRRLAPKFYLEAELRDWIPIGGTDFESNVIRYGVGVSYLLYDTGTFRIQPTLEFVGWTFLGGQELNPDTGAAQGAEGDTIVNAKVGARFGFGRLTQPGFLSPADFAVTYGRALTGDFIYKDIVRGEFRLRF
jgi:hypothetical protein